MATPPEVPKLSFCLGDSVTSREQSQLCQDYAKSDLANPLFLVLF